MIVPVILCGGSGTRLWPLSRELYPKQFMPLLDSETTLLQATARRAMEMLPDSRPIVVCNENHRFMVAAQLQAAGIGADSILLEPAGRGTAPAIAVAALEAIERTAGGDPLLFVLPADHYMADAVPLGLALRRSTPPAEEGKLVLFGIPPAGAETEYGYIRTNRPLSPAGDDGSGEPDMFGVAGFVEKPESSAAESFQSSGEYLWNTGIFLMKSSSYLEHLSRFAPQVLECASSAHSKARRDLDFLRLDGESFEVCPNVSIDYAVIEKTADAVVVLLETGWRDLGAWSRIYEVIGKDEMGNATVGDVILKGVSNSYVNAQSRLVAAIGVDRFIIVETKDAVLIAPMENAQEVRHVVEELQERGREEAKTHSRVYRPWGDYESIDFGERFQVKRITVAPGSKLSLQKHMHRAEHWIVVKGTAKMTRDSEEILLSENQSTYVPLGMVHRIENPGRIPLEIIEVQTGSYLQEDDIVRLDDVYGRAEQK